MQQILLLTEIYFPEETSTGYLLTQIAEGLAEDYIVKVITGPPTNFLQKTRSPDYELKNKVEIFRCKGTNFNKNSLLGRCVNLVTRTVAIFGKVVRLAQSQDIVLVVTNPPLLPLVALLLKWIKGCNFVLLIHDVYPEVLVATGLCESSSFIVKAGQMINWLFYNQASRIVTLGRDMTKLAKAKLRPDEENKVVCIPNWAENHIVWSTDRASNPLLQELDISDRFVVLYTGNMGRTHDIELIGKAVKALKKCPDIHFLVIGFGYYKKWLEEYINSHNLKNINIVSLFDRPRSEQIVSVNAGDVALISFVPGMAGVSVPSRMYNQMAAGKPIIAVTDDWSELAEVIREEEIGWVVKPGDAETLVKTIQFAAENPNLCARMGAKAAITAQSKYSFFQTDQAYKQLFRELFTRPQS